MATETKTFYPGAYDASASSIESISNAKNPVGKGTGNTTCASVYMIAGSGATTTVFWPFDLSSLPDEAEISAVSCKVKAGFDSITGVNTSGIQLYSGSTAKGSSKTFTNTGWAVVTITAGNWTRSELKNCRLRLYAKRSSVNNSVQRSIDFYGADLTVTYTYQSEKFMLKLGGAYNDIARTFKKVSGIWVEQTELANVIEDGVRYKNGGEYVAPKKTVTIKGAFSSSYGYVTINGTKYTSAATVQVEAGTTAAITIGCDMYNLLCTVTLDGATVHTNSNTGAETYSFVVTTDCTITLTSTGYGGGYKADIVTT